MAVRVRYKWLAAISSTSAEEKDLGNATYEVVNDLLTEGGSWKFTVPVSATDLVIPLPNLTSAKFILVRTSPKDPTLAPVALSFKLNTVGASAIPVEPLSGESEGVMAISSSGITALYVTNSSGTVAMEVAVMAAGD